MAKKRVEEMPNLENIRIDTTPVEQVQKPLMQATEEPEPQRH